jgi:transcriptional regulator with XRE-family HTH domain
MGLNDNGAAKSHFKGDEGRSTADSDRRREDRAVAKREHDPGRRREAHRLAAVRRQQGISLKNMARRLGIDVESVIEQEQESADPRLSTIYAWQKILEVPMVELLVDSDAPLSAPVYERARMVKLMKTAAAILETARIDSVRRLATNLIEQLVAIMPELREVTAWHTVGQRRTLEEYGRILERQVPDDFSARQEH